MKKLKYILGTALLVSFTVTSCDLERYPLTDLSEETFWDKDKNAEEKQVAKFLAEEEYEFGYATYWNANIMTELTNGYVEVANVQDVDSMSMFYWSSPAMYYQEGYHQGKTFLLLTTEELVKYEDSDVVRIGEKIYEDNGYVVYHYDAVEDLLQ